MNVVEAVVLVLKNIGGDVVWVPWNVVRAVVLILRNVMGPAL